MPDSVQTRDVPPLPRRRVVTPTVLQMEAVECGAAALTKILRYHGCMVSLEEVRVECGVSRDGSKAANLLKAARRYGFKAEGRHVDLAYLKQVQLPFIAFWNFNHFLVVEGYSRRGVHLNDPAGGRRVVTREMFDEAFTGLVLTFKPEPDFKPNGRLPTLFSRLQSYLAGSSNAVVYTVSVSLLLLIPGLLVPVFSKVFIDEVLVHRFDGWLRPLLIGLGLLAVLRGVLVWLRQHYLLRLETRLALTASSRFLWHALRMPAVFFTQRFGSEVGARVMLNDRVASLLSNDLATAALDLLSLFFFVGMMAYYDPLLAVVALLFGAGNFYALHKGSRVREEASRRAMQEAGKYNTASMIGLQTIESIKAGGREDTYFRGWWGHHVNMLNAQQALSVPGHVLNALPGLLNGLALVTILGIGGTRVIEGDLSIGTLVAVQGLMMAFADPISRLVKLGGTVQDMTGSIDRLDDVLCHSVDPACRDEDQSPLSADSEEPKSDPQPKLVGRLELRNLTFGYARLSRPLIEDLNLTVRPGSRVALVGPSGCGKSTIARLVAGLYAPWSGGVLVDGKPEPEWPRITLCHSRAMVDQDIFLFAGTLRENLTLWDATVPEQHIVQAAKDACIHDDVMQRRDGYETLVKENGTNFSGGQRQRIEIARALVNNPSLLILDEATSALDVNTELEIDRNLRRRGCTCLIIAHRLSTIRDCDEIVVLDRGRVVERGTHDELIADDGLYHSLVKHM